MTMSLIWLSQLFYLLLLLYSQLTSTSSSALLCSQDQSYALLQFKHLFSFSKEASSFCEEVGHLSYPKMESWQEDTNCCLWDGVRCDTASGDVVGLDLSCSWLIGTIPSNSFLFLLPHLQHLNLAYNYFNHSPISFRFGQFARLNYLNLSYSMFSGKVPFELSHLSQLASLDLSGYGYPDHDFPTPRGKGPSLFGHLYGNVSLEASVVKSLVQNMTKLRELHLDHVDMSSVPLSSLMNLSSSLTSLSLNNCLLRGRLLDHIFRLTNLRELSLANNPELTWFSPMLNWSRSLRFLDVSYTIYSGELPKSIGKLKFLRNLILSGCNFNGSIPTWLGNLTQLTHLNLSTNNFGGQMPSSLSNLKALSSLDLRFNNLSGAIPIWVGNLTRVTEILFGINKFTGQIPSSFSKLKDLTWLGLGYNNIEGRIPDFLTNLTKLTTVFLSHNQLSGQFGESQFSNSLEILALDNNNLYGSIPKSLSNLVNLTYLGISSNDLTSFPSTICNVTFLEMLDISDNNFSGTIPPCLGNFSKFLSVMDLRMNNFHGNLPENFAEGNRLRSLACNGNQLEGLLPKSLVNCINLEVLDLGNNKINDCFPHWLEALPKLQVLVLRSNNFYGPINNHKTSGMFFSKLRILDISHNEFIGPLPTKLFEELKAIKITNESEEDLKYMGEKVYLGLPGAYRTQIYLLGEYHDSVIIAMKGYELDLEKILTILTIIDMSRNNFYGKIPEVLGTLNSLIVLNLSHNRLTGHIPSSLANLSALESLDLSSNMLTGEIPIQLTSLTFLAVLNLSHNMLIGPIPQGKQFDTFQNVSYDGNLGLCGFPLSMKCGTNETPLPSILQEDNDSMFASGFGWKAVLMGYGCGLMFGLSMGYIALETGKPEWLVRFVNKVKRKLKTRRRNKQRPIGERRK